MAQFCKVETENKTKTSATTGIVFFAGYFTLGKGQRTLGKDFIGKGFFAECFFRTLGKDFSECQKALGKLRIEKIKIKTAKHFLNFRNNSSTLPYYLTRCPIILHYYFESNLYVL
jgi:hypothetical protein